MNKLQQVESRLDDTTGQFCRVDRNGIWAYVCTHTHTQRGKAVQKYEYKYDAKRTIVTRHET